MSLLRVGSRGSELALRQTRWVCDLLTKADPRLAIEVVVIRTHGDAAPDQPIDQDWPMGGFVGTIEKSLLENRIDLAVHSYKDMPSAPTPGLTVAAVPPREAAHDVLVTRNSIDPGFVRRPRFAGGANPHFPNGSEGRMKGGTTARVSNLRSDAPLSPLERRPGEAAREGVSNPLAGLRIGTSSPRRRAQLQWFFGRDVHVVPMRGNVPTRLEKVASGELDGVVLAAAGLRRLNLSPAHCFDLPIDLFVPAPAQGALAVQLLEADPRVALVRSISDSTSEVAITAERSFLRSVEAGCQMPVGAHASVTDVQVSLHGQLFSEDGSRMVEGREMSQDGAGVGRRLALRLMRELTTCSS